MTAPGRGSIFEACPRIAFEIGKFSAVAGSASVAARAMRLALVALVAVLMALNSIGVYGFLSRAHIEHALAGDGKVSVAASHIDAQLDAKQATWTTSRLASPSSTRPWGG